MTVGEKIREVRISRNMSQEELAYKMGYKDRSSITKIEKSADDKIPMNTVQKAAEALRCSPLYLMGWSDNESDNIISSRQQEAVERANRFVNLYSQLKESEQIVVDKLLESLTSEK